MATEGGAKNHLIEDMSLTEYYRIIRKWKRYILIVSVAIAGILISVHYLSYRKQPNLYRVQAVLKPKFIEKDKNGLSVYFTELSILEKVIRNEILPEIQGRKNGSTATKICNFKELKYRDNKKDNTLELYAVVPDGKAGLEQLIRLSRLVQSYYRKIATENNRKKIEELQNEIELLNIQLENKSYNAQKELKILNLRLLHLKRRKEIYQELINNADISPLRDSSVYNAIALSDQEGKPPTADNSSSNSKRRSHLSANERENEPCSNGSMFQLQYLLGLANVDLDIGLMSHEINIIKNKLKQINGSLSGGIPTSAVQPELKNIVLKRKTIQKQLDLIMADKPDPIEIVQTHVSRLSKDAKMLRTVLMSLLIGILIAMLTAFIIEWATTRVREK